MLPSLSCLLRTFSSLVFSGADSWNLLLGFSPLDSTSRLGELAGLLLSSLSEFLLLGGETIRSFIAGDGESSFLETTGLSILCLLTLTGLPSRELTSLPRLWLFLELLVHL